MEQYQIPAAIIVGFILRIGIPIGLTILLATFLRKLDAHWREEAERHAIEDTMLAQRETLLNLWLGQPCYTIKNCTPQQKSNCQVISQTEKPCWEIHRSNGNLANGCQDCQYRKELFLTVEHENL